MRASELIQGEIYTYSPFGHILNKEATTSQYRINLTRLSAINHNLQETVTFVEMSHGNALVRDINHKQFRVSPANLEMKK